jgi:hypothetical protein
MKNKIKSGTMVALMALLSVSAVAQETTKENKQSDRPELRKGEFGVRYMACYSSLELKTFYGDIIQGDVTMSNGFGAILAGNFSKNIGIQAEVSYLAISQKYKDQNLERKVDVSYLNIPIMLSINTDKTRMLNLNFVAGPQFGINVGSSTQTAGTENSGTLHGVVVAKGTDIGIAYGTGLEISLNRMHTFRLDFGYRGFYGLADVSTNQSSNKPDTYNVIVRGSRMTQAAYVGLTLCF